MGSNSQPLDLTVRHVTDCATMPGQGLTLYYHKSYLSRYICICIAIPTLIAMNPVS